MKAFQTKRRTLPGTSYQEVLRRANDIWRRIKSHTRRRPYIRSAYFKKEKIFFDYFWDHLFQKSWSERTKRLKFFACAIELVKESRHDPASKENPNKRDEILHRFAGLTRNKEIFYVQIKEDKKTGKKFFMSVFSPE